MVWKFRFAQNRSCHVYNFTCGNPYSFYIRLTPNGKKMGWEKKQERL